MTFYSEMAAMVADLLKPDTQGGLGQEVIEISRLRDLDPDNPWGGSTYDTETLRGAARGIGQALVGTEVGGTVLLATDKLVTCATPSIPYKAGDRLSLDGRSVHIISYEPIPAVGRVCAVKFIVRG